MSLPRITRLVSAPSHIDIRCRSDRTEADRIGLIVSYYISPISPIVRSLTASRGVPPYLVELAVLCAKLLTLLCVIPGLLVRSPIVRISVPRGNVQTHLYVIFVAGINEFTYNVTLTVLIGTVLYRMLGVL